MAILEMQLERRRDLLVGEKCHFADLLMVLALVEVPEVIYLWDPAELTSEICRESLLL